MDERRNSRINRLGGRMIVFALDSARGRVHLERVLRTTGNADAAALTPAAWLESALLWAGLRLGGARAPLPR